MVRSQVCFLTFSAAPDELSKITTQPTALAVLAVSLKDACHNEGLPQSGHRAGFGPGLEQCAARPLQQGKTVCHLPARQSVSPSTSAAHVHIAPSRVSRPQFSMQPVSAWPVGDGTLGTFSSPTKSHQLFAHQLRDLGEFGVTNSTASDKLDLKHPTWKTPVVPEVPLVRVPKRMRLGIAGGELGPAFVQ